MAEHNCIFCKIIQGEIPSYTLYEDDLFKMILDIQPASKGHMLILPKRHAQNLLDLGEKEEKQLLSLAKKAGKQAMLSLGANGFHVLQNNGEAAGQTVLHFHLHIIPRYDGDDLSALQWKPLAFPLETFQNLVSELSIPLL
ncbi:histidine triad protein [Clostridia bacterium]|nr:histidine triad protein [Clostridia bacterium]